MENHYLIKTKYPFKNHFILFSFIKALKVTMESNWQFSFLFYYIFCCVAVFIINDQSEHNIIKLN